MYEKWEKTTDWHNSISIFFNSKKGTKFKFALASKEKTQ